MASRMWNQISSVKYLKHGTFRTCTSVAERSLGRSSPEFGKRNFSASRDLSSSAEPTPQEVKEGRFIRNAPGPMKPGDQGLRPSLRYRIAHGPKQVARNAENGNRGTSRAQTNYRLRDYAGLRANESHIKRLKHEFVRRQSVAYLQPHSLIGFCSKEVPSFGREDVKPTQFVVGKMPKRHMSNFARIIDEEDTESMLSEEAVVMDKEATTEVVSGKSNHSIRSMQTIHSAKSNTVSLVDAEGANLVDVPLTQSPNQSLSEAVSVPGTSSTEKKYIGYGFTQLVTPRPFSTFAQRTATSETITPNVTITQTRGLIPKDCKKKTCPKPKKPKDMGEKDCSKNRKDEFPEGVHKHEGRWNKCECCPEMLKCDQTTCTYVDPFPCICEDYPQMCPIDCPPPCEPPPPRKVPLNRPPKCPVYQHLKECKPDKCPKKCMYIEKRTLPKIPSDCCCVEPFLPTKMPRMKLVKKHVYQCTEECKPPCCHTCVDLIATPKCLPPICPGECPCIEPKIADVPPLRRLNIQAYQKQRECIPKKCPIIEQPKCIERRSLPKIKSDCCCIEPKPLKPVPLVRLPPICVCPEPPDPKCYPEKCPLRADEVCKWKFPKKKLVNWWCPNCKMPKDKYKFCRCKDRNQCGKNKCPERKCFSTFTTMQSYSTINDGTFTVRPYSSFAKKELVANGEPQPSTSKSVKAVSNKGMFGSSLLKRNNTSPLMQRRSFHASGALLKKKKKKCSKSTCPKICGQVCCEPPARDTCKPFLKPLCCKAKQSPYPAFSECGEFHQILTCECKHSMPYLQPNFLSTPMTDRILKETVPKHRIIDPTPEEHCMLHDLCRPRGHTYTCETFHRGEYVPLTQYECMSPHRLPCCERDQICDFAFRRSEKKCDGKKKEREYYRCECACPKPKKRCDGKKPYKLQTATSKRSYSTSAGVRRFSTLCRKPLEVLPKVVEAQVPSASTAGASFHSSAAVMKRPAPRVGGQDMCRPKCPHKCKKNKKKRCGKPMSAARFPGAAKSKKETKIDAGISTRLKQHFQKTMECSGARSSRAKHLAEAKCAAQRVGMKLVADHSKCCKMATKCKVQADTKCGPMPECKRPKNVCCPCDPRYEVDECRKKKVLADCCAMPYKMSGTEFRMKMPPCCKMPIPVCNRMCMRVSATCEKEYVPCCVTEAPFPAFSDCHPPFKRLTMNECQVRDLRAEESSSKIDGMVKNMGKGKRHYSTVAKSAPMPVIEEEASNALNAQSSKSDSVLEMVRSLFGEKEAAKGLHEPVDCKCPRCMSMRSEGVRNIKPDLRRNIVSVLPSCQGDKGFDNLPEMIFTKEDIFKQVDSENLISLAPEDMSPIEKVKCFLFNKANKVTDAPPLDLPVDGFECFTVSSQRDLATTTSMGKGGAVSDSKTRSYSTSKAVEEELCEEATDEVANQTVGDVVEEEVKKVLPHSRPVITLSNTSDLVYLLEDGKSTIDLSYKKTAGQKVKVIPHPICTHILLDSGELLLENEFLMMTTILPLKNRLYLPYGLSHDEFTELEKQNIKSIQNELGKMLIEKENS